MFLWADEVFRLPAVCGAVCGRGLSHLRLSLVERAAGAHGSAGLRGLPGSACSGRHSGTGGSEVSGQEDIRKGRPRFTHDGFWGDAADVLLVWVQPGLSSL